MSERHGKALLYECSGNFGVASSYTFIVLDFYELNLQKILYSQQSDLLYPYEYSFFMLQEKSYTVIEYREYLEQRQRASSEMFWKTILPGVLYYVLSFVIIPIVAIVILIFAIWLFIVLYQHRKKKKLTLQDNLETSES